MGSGGGGSPLPGVSVGGLQSTLDSWKRNYTDRAAAAATSALNPRANNLAGTLARAGRDVVGGAGDIAQGRVSKGLVRAAGGYTAAVTAGGSESLLPTTDTQEMMQENAIAEEQRLVQEGINSRETARRDAIRKRIDAEVAYRMRSPGKSQTLLTSLSGTNSLLPTGNNTLLTTGR